MPEFSKGEHFNDLAVITKGAGITFVGRVGGKAILFLYTVFLAKVLSNSELGLYFLGITIIGFIAILSTLGFKIGVTRYVAIYRVADDPGKINGTVWAAGLLSFFFGLILIGLTLAFSDTACSLIFQKPELARVLKVLSLSIPFTSLMWIFLAATRGFKFVHYTTYTEDFIWVASRSFFAVILVYGFGNNLEAASWAFVASSILSAGVGFCFMQKVFPFIGQKIRPAFEIKRLLNFSIPMVFSAFLGNMTRQIDVIMLGLFVTAAEVGLYSVAIRLILLAEVVFQIFIPIFNPFVADLHEKKEHSKLAELLKVITKWNVTISFPVFLALLFAPQFFLGFFGKEFLSASGCLSILVIAHIFSSLSALPSSVIFMSGKPSITFRNNMAMLLLNGSLNYVLIPKYGIIGAALATAISLLIVAILLITELHYLHKFHPFGMNLWKPLTSGAVSLAVIMLLRAFIGYDNHLLIPFLLVLFLCLYSVMIFALRLDDEDLFIAKGVKRKLAFLKTKRTK